MQTDHDPYLTFLRRSLYVRLPYLCPAIGGLNIAEREQGSKVLFATDGIALFVSADAVRELVASDSVLAQILYLREVLLCLLGFPLSLSMPDPGEAEVSSRMLLSRLVPEWKNRLKDPLPMDPSLWFSFRAGEKMISPAGGNGGDRPGEEGREAAARRWERLLSRLPIRTDGELRHRGDSLASHVFVPTLTGESRARYRDFLSGFARLRENPRPNPDEFSYADYFLGLSIADAPFLEPPEYTEERKLDELVIVIDTSASCEGEPVRIFLEETRNILIDEALFFSRFHLRILQCDNRIRHDAVIRDRRDFESYLHTLTLTGGGGTDYRPAFAYVDSLAASGAFSHLAGMVVFTDGRGHYPSAMPSYPCAFVLPEGISDVIDMPDWILRLFIPRKGTLREQML